jgi:hypothetical protein
MFAAPPAVETTVFARIPGGQLLEGPSFDRQGQLWVTDIPTGRIFRVAPDGDADQGGGVRRRAERPQDRRDGRIFIADHKQGLLTLDPGSGTTRVALDRPYGERFHGLNDLLFARNGDLYFTDQGESDLRHANGRLYRLRADGALDCLLDNVPSPNGLVLTPDESILYLAVTRANAIWRVPLASLGGLHVGRLGLGRVGAWVQMSAASVPTAWRWTKRAASRWRTRAWARCGCSAAQASQCVACAAARGCGRRTSRTAGPTGARSTSPRPTRRLCSAWSWTSPGCRCTHTRADRPARGAH